MVGIEKQLEEVRRQLAPLAAAMGTALPKQEVEAKRVINSNEAKVEEEKRKEMKKKKIKEMKKEVEERKKKEEKAFKEAEKLAAQVQSLRESHKKAAEA